MSKIKVTNPYDGLLVAELSTQSEDSCFAALEAEFQSHRRLRSGPPLYERRRVLESALTILLNPSPHSKISQREIFGPVVCIYSYDDLATAIESANSLPYAFHASVFTPHISTADSLVDALDATCVLINEHPAFRVDWMPFGGRRHSGIGLGGIGHSISDMTLNKLVIQKY